VRIPLSRVLPNQAYQAEDVQSLPSVVPLLAIEENSGVTIIIGILIIVRFLVGPIRYISTQWVFMVSEPTQASFQGRLNLLGTLFEIVHETSSTDDGFPAVLEDYCLFDSKELATIVAIEHVWWKPNFDMGEQRAMSIARASLALVLGAFGFRILDS
jgi:hypothetical protein